LHYARTLDSATVTVHRALIDPEVFKTLLDVGIKNNCYMISKDASEDVVALRGIINDLIIEIHEARYMRAVEKGPTHVRTYDLQPNDLIVAHYHCGIPPDPSSIDINTMKIALKAQLFATIPGKPRVFGIISPTIAGRSFCLDIGIYEPLPNVSIVYNTKKLKIRELDVIEMRKKGLAVVEYDEGEYYFLEVCDEPHERCVPYRYGTVGELVAEDLIFIASYSLNFKRTEFPYLKIAPSKSVVYEVKVSKLSAEDVVIRGVSWNVLKVSPRELRSI